MKKALTLAKTILSDTLKDYTEDLKEINLYDTLEKIFYIETRHSNKNRLIAFAIYAYDPESPKINLSKDRFEDKISIAKSIELDPEEDIIKSIIVNENDHFNEAVMLYLSSLTDWRWQTIFTMVDYHSNMIRFANQKTDAERTYEKLDKEGAVKSVTTEIEIDKISKVNIQKHDLISRALQSRRDADILMEEIRKDFASTDHAVQQDFGFSFTQTAKTKIDPMSWKEWLVSGKKSNVSK